jgi:hypothetical protein
VFARGAVRDRVQPRLVERWGAANADERPQETLTSCRGVLDNAATMSVATGNCQSPHPVLRRVGFQKHSGWRSMAAQDAVQTERREDRQANHTDSVSVIGPTRCAGTWISAHESNQKLRSRPGCVAD